jgi:acetyl esterase/lipase
MTVIQKLKLIGHVPGENPFTAGVGGRTDIPCWDADAATSGWADTAGYNKPHARIFGDFSFGTHTGVRCISLNDFVSSTGMIGAVTSKGGPSAPAGPFSVFSLRYYTLMPVKAPAMYAAPGQIQDVIPGPPYISTVNLMSGDTQVDPLLCWCNIARPFPQVRDADQSKLIIPNNNSTTVANARTGLTSAKWVNKWVRVEAQFNNAFTPKMVVRLYEDDNTVPFQTWSYSPSFTSIDSVGITSADNGSPSGSFASQVRIALLEVCNTYDLDGQFPGGTAAVATTTNVSGTGTPETEQTNYVYPANQVVRTDVVTENFPSTPQYYAYRSSPDMTAAIWIPDGYAPTTNGFPVAIWSHSGFFITGTFGDIPANWRSTLLNAGYAVVSIEYVKSTVAVGSYDSFGSPTTQHVTQDGEPGFGKYPSWFIDYKLLAARLGQEALDNGWNIDASRIIATGYSAGGYIALGAAVSEGVTDSEGRDLTIAGNPTYADGYTGPDPHFLGAFCYVPPCDLQAACDYDTTDPGLPPLLYGLAGLSDRGAVNIAARAFIGQVVSTVSDPDLTGTSIPEIIAARDALDGSVPPVACVWGSGDFLIHKWGHDPVMAASMTAAGADYTSIDAETIHDWANQEFDPDAIIDWMNARVVESGGVPGPPSATPPATGAPAEGFIGHDEYHDAGTAWPSSLTITAPPAGTSRGDRCYLTVLGYGTTTTLDNWNLGADWTLLASENGTAGTSGGQRSSIHVYTARHEDGSPFPATISPRTSGGALITSGTYYQAHVYSITPSYPVSDIDLARGGNTPAQPDDDRGGMSAASGAYLLQLTGYLSPSTRTLASINPTGGAVGTFTEQAHMAPVTGRGGDLSIADVVTTGAASGSLWATYTQGGSGGGINLRAALVVHGTTPDAPLTDPVDPCEGLTSVSVPAADPVTFTLEGETITITTLSGTGGTVYDAVGSGLVADGADYADPAIYVAAGYGTLLAGTPVNYSVTASLVGSGCTLTADPTVRLVGVVDGVGTVIATGTATDTGGDVWHLSLSHVLAATWYDVYVITSAPTECA